MVEIEIGVLAAQCLDRRIDSTQQLVAETAAWEQQRNAAGHRIKSPHQNGRAYPNPSAKSGPVQRVKTTVQGY
jgi:hypothetical protein